MQHLEILAHALEYIECNIANPIKTEDIAMACYCSKTALEKIFRYKELFEELHTTIMESKENI